MTLRFVVYDHEGAVYNIIEFNPGKRTDGKFDRHTQVWFNNMLSNLRELKEDAEKNGAVPGRAHIQIVG